MNTLVAGNLKSKTSWFSTLLIVFGTLNDSTDLLKAIIPPNNAHVGAIIAGIGIITLILRNITTQSIAEKATPPAPPAGK